MNRRAPVVLALWCVSVWGCQQGTPSTSKPTQRTGNSPPKEALLTAQGPATVAGDPEAARALIPSAPAAPTALSNVDDFAAGAPTPATPAGSKAAAPPQVVEAPMSLTGGDGTGLKLLSVQARAVVDGPLAFTELELTFENPEARRREGRFAITLPSGAAISRFAMEIGGRWMEGEVVEKQRARRIYEDFLHRRQDPAILEQDAGNTFRARVFPIEANAKKKLIVSYSQTLVDGSSAYTLPLRGLPVLDELSIRAFVHTEAGGKPAASLGGTVGSVQVISVNKTGFEPREDFRVFPGFGHTPTASGDGLRVENIALARVRASSAVPADGFGRVVVLVDTSASQAPGFAARLERLAGLMDFLARGKASEVFVIAFDQEASPIFRGAPGEFGAAQLTAIRDRGALGASNLAVGLDAAQKALAGTDGARLMLLTNGVFTAGPREPDALRELVAGVGAARVDTITTTTARDDGLLAALVTAEGLRAGVNLTLDAVDQTADAAALGRLALATFDTVKVEVPGASWVWPRELKGLQPGQDTLIYADLPEGKPFGIQFTGGVEASFEPATRPAPKALLERAWVGARIALLAHRSAEGDPDLRAAFQQQAIKLSIEKRVLSPWTALLVLETEHDYRRYGIDRTALADILTVSADGVAVMQARTEPTFVPPAPVVPRPRVRPREDLKDAIGRGAPGDAGGAPDDRAAAAPPTGQIPGAKLDDEPAVLFEAEPAAEAAAVERKPAEAAKSANRPLRVSKMTSTKFLPRPKGGAAAAGSEPADPAAASAGTDAPAQMECGAAVVIAAQRARRALTRCSERLAAGKTLSSFVWRVTIAPNGSIRVSPVRGEPSAALQQCVVAAMQSVRVPARTAECQQEVPLLSMAAPKAPGPPGQAPPSLDSTGTRELKELHAKMEAIPGLTGELADIQVLIDQGNAKTALERARTWRAKSPVDVLALVALGRALEATGETTQAARAYGSLLDLYPSRADLRRFAGNLLESLGDAQRGLAIDTYRAAVEQRPDHPSGYAMLGFALAAAGETAEAMKVFEDGIGARNRSMNFPEVPRILKEGLGLVASVHIAKHPDARAEVMARVGRAGGELPDAEELRFILTWETDANDVDFHIFDNRNAHASYRQKNLSSGGRLYADVTRGYGPECFTITKPAAAPYRLFANYYTRGPMGYGMGRLQVVRTDGDGGLTLESRPFVIMADRAWVELGEIKLDGGTSK